MKAFVIPRSGAPGIELMEVPVPEIGDDELLVQVKAVGVGIHDSYFLPGNGRYPYPIGIEAAGVIAEVGSEVSGYRPGDRIAFVNSMQPKGGTWAEFVAVKETSLILTVPEGMDLALAAAVPVAGSTILKAFHALGEVAPGRSLFIAGGSGAIGTFAIQIARHRGWLVGALASTANHGFMSSLGAELTVDYHAPNWAQKVFEWMPGGVDAVVAVQPGSSIECLPVVRNGGSLVSISGDSVVAERGIQVRGIAYQADISEELVQLMTHIARGEFHVELDRGYPFESGLEALAKVQTRHARGKTVLRMD